MAEKFLLKEQLFNRRKVFYLSSLIKKVYPKFKDKEFQKEVLEKFPELELKERISHIRRKLKNFLPDDYLKSLEIILKALPKELDHRKNDNDFGDFIFAPLSDFVAKYGCQEKFLKKSLSALEEMTKRFSAEDSIRYFINAFPEKSMEKIEEWSKNKNYHLRRLASEGTRPKLPWCQRINLDYKIPIKILDNLHCDETRFVVRSVANHLNDISKVDGELVVKILRRWIKTGGRDEKEMNYLVSHSLRTLVKEGNQGALQILGYKVPVGIKVESFKIKKSNIKIGEYLEFSFSIFSEVKQNLLIDYIIFFKTKNGNFGKKVFKIKKVKVGKNEKISISKKHLFKIMTTRKLYEGEHQLELQINGKSFGKIKFQLDRK